MRLRTLFGPSRAAWQLAAAALLGACVGAIVTVLVMPTGGGKPRREPTRATGQDTIAKSDAESLAKVVEACASTEGGNYTNCDGSRFKSTGLPIGPAAGQVQTTAVTPGGYVVIAESKSGNRFG